MHLLRNLARRKLRTTLTILGITIGIWALVVMSSMANKINSLVEGGSTYYENKISVKDVNDRPLGLGFIPMRISDAQDIGNLPGVAASVPTVSMFLESDFSRGPNFSRPDIIYGMVAGSDKGREVFEVNIAQGRELDKADEGSNVVVLGADIARKFSKSSGDTMDIRGRSFQVVGILEATLTAQDTFVAMPLLAAQTLFAETLPSIIQGDLKPEQLASDIIVYPDPGTNITELAKTIETFFPHVQTLTGEEFDEQIGSATAIFNSIIIGIALISLTVGGLSVINTMAMSVAERTREIGIKRAIGASRTRIVRELVTEAGIIGLIGGGIGLALGALVVIIANEIGRASGTVLFELTFETALFSVGFATILGMVAGCIPAWNASRMDPVQALRAE